MSRHANALFASGNGVTLDFAERRSALVRMSPEPPFAQSMIRRLVQHESSESQDRAPLALYAAAHGLHIELCQWLGRAGCRSLFVRVLLNVRREHPVFAAVQVRPDVDWRHIDEIVRTAGPTEAEAGLNALIVMLIELLGRFIGDDMVETLVERTIAGQRNAKSEHERGEDS